MSLIAGHSLNRLTASRRGVLCSSTSNAGVFDTVTTLNRNTNAEAIVLDFGFQGMRKDMATGWYVTPKRVYLTPLGVWGQQDPAGYVDGANLYQFVGSNPVARKDPSGLDATVEVVEGDGKKISGGAATAIVPGDIKVMIECKQKDGSWTVEKVSSDYKILIIVADKDYIKAGVKQKKNTDIDDATAKDYQQFFANSEKKTYAQPDKESWDDLEKKTAAELKLLEKTSVIALKQEATATITKDWLKKHADVLAGLNTTDVGRQAETAPKSADEFLKELQAHITIEFIGDKPPATKP